MPSLLHTFIDSVAKRIQRSPMYFERYNNTLDFKTNRVWTSYAHECMAAYKKENGAVDLPPSPLVNNAATLVHNAFPLEKAQLYSAKIGELIERKDPRVEESKKEGRSVHVDAPITTLGPGILDVLRSPEVHRQLLSFFRSHYRIQWATCYRSFPTEQVAGSWLWHSDSFPPYTCKMFLHLTKATTDTGATEFMNREDTMAYRRAGYFGQFLSERYADLQDFAKDKNIPYRPFHLDAAAGDATICDVSFFHRAVAPRADFRDIVSFFFVPNDVHWEKQLERDGLDSLSHRKASLPKDPHQGHVIGVKGTM